MADLLDLFDEGGRFENEVRAAALYVDQKRPHDFTARIVEFGVAQHENDNSPRFGKEYLGVRLEILDGEAALSRKIGAKNYQEVNGRPGDSVSLYFPLSADGMTKSAAANNFRDLCTFIAVLEDASPDDYVKGGRIGPQGIRASMAKDTEHLGKVLRIAAQTANKGGYYNSKYELVPSDEPKTKKGKVA